MGYMKATIIFCLLSLATASPPSKQDYGLCSQVYLMHQYCTSQMSPGSAGMTHRPAVHPRVGKAGPVGPPGSVNYTAIWEKIAAKYLDLEARNDENFGRLNGIIEARLEGGDAAIERIRNETAESSESIEENQKVFESRIDEKCEQMERNVNRHRERGTEEIATMRNETRRVMEEYRRDLEARNDENFGRLNGSIEARLEGGDAAIERIRNETAKSSKSIEENQKDLKTRFDERFARLERIIEAGLNRGDTEIEKLRNENTINSNSIEESRRAINSLRPSSCDEVAANWKGNDGVVEIYRDGTRYEVYCDRVTDGGRWTVFQRRVDGTVDFYRDWEDYARGFGHKSGEFWLGLEAVYQLTQEGAYELRIDLTDWDGSTRYAKYGTFSISGRSDNYRLTVGDYAGTAGDSLTYHNNHLFSAKNKDLDVWSSGSCATGIGAAWWFVTCSHSSLNGRYNGTSDPQSGVLWQDWKGRSYSLKGSEMKFRKK